MIGIDSFILLNDNSTDDTQCLLDAYAEEGLVQRIPEDIDDAAYVSSEYVETRTRTKNDRVFDVCARYLKGTQGADRTWMLTHDADEFLWFKKSPHVHSLTDAILKLITSDNPSIQSLIIPRLTFGASGHEKYEQGLVIDRFTRRYSAARCPMLTDSARQDIQKPHVGSLAFCPKKASRRSDYKRGKSMSLVSALAGACYRRNGVSPKMCNGPHRHTLKDLETEESETETNGLNTHDTRYLEDPEMIGANIALMHYVTKSREEFYERTCGSVWLSKYKACSGCSPESNFNLAEAYANNFEDRRMADFAAQLKPVLEKPGIGATCDQRPMKHSLEYYTECMESNPLED